MKTGKRILSVLLAVLMLAATMCVAFAAEEEIKPLYVTYQLPLIETWAISTLDVYYQNPKYPYSKPDYENECSWYLGNEDAEIYDEDTPWYLCIRADLNRPFYIYVNDQTQLPNDGGVIIGTHRHQLVLRGFEYASCKVETTGSYYCLSCKQTFTVTFPAAHIYGEEIVRREPSCVEGGIYSRYCARCNEVKTFTGEPWGHSYYEEETVPATCFTDGYIKKVCWNCGKIIMITDNQPKATGKHVDKDGNNHCDVCGKLLTQPTTTPTQPTPAKPAVNPNACKYCGKVHTGTFAGLVKFFHNIMYFLVGRKK